MGSSGWYEFYWRASHATAAIQGELGLAAGALMLAVIAIRGMLNSHKRIEKLEAEMARLKGEKP